MKSVIILQGDELEQFYEDTMQYLYEKYHTYPDVLPDIPLTPHQAAELSAYECMAAQLAGSQSNPASLNRNRLNRDPHYSNGLRRRRFR
jgi:hypothetical protein